MSIKNINQHNKNKFIKYKTNNNKQDYYNKCQSKLINNQTYESKEIFNNKYSSFERKKSSIMNNNKIYNYNKNKRYKKDGISIKNIELISFCIKSFDKTIDDFKFKTTIYKQYNIKQVKGYLYSKLRKENILSGNEFIKSLKIKNQSLLEYDKIHFNFIRNDSINIIIEQKNKFKKIKYESYNKCINEPKSGDKLSPNSNAYNNLTQIKNDTITKFNINPIYKNNIKYYQESIEEMLDNLVNDNLKVGMSSRIIKKEIQYNINQNKAMIDQYFDKIEEPSSSEQYYKYKDNEIVMINEFEQCSTKCSTTNSSPEKNTNDYEILI